MTWFVVIRSVPMFCSLHFLGCDGGIPFLELGVTVAITWRLSGDFEQFNLFEQGASHLRVHHPDIVLELNPRDIEQVEPVGVSLTEFGDKLLESTACDRVEPFADVIGGPLFHFGSDCIDNPFIIQLDHREMVSLLENGRVQKVDARVLNQLEI